MQINIINKRTNKIMNLSSYIYSSGILVTKFDPGKVPASFNKNKAIGQHGYTLQSTTLEDREVNIEATIIANDKVERDTMKREIDDILNPLDSLLIKYDDSGISKEIECSIEETPDYSTEFKTNNDYFLGFKISFECFKPFWVDQKQTVLNIETWQDGFEFEFELLPVGIEFAKRGPNEILINNDGNIEAPLEIYFKGPALNPQITFNDKKFIKVNKSLAENEILYINTSYDNKRVQIFKGELIEQAYHYIDIESSFFDLQSGTNKISYSTEGDYLPQEVIMKYKRNYFSL